MLTAALRMSRNGASATNRTKAIARHMMSTSATLPSEEEVVFESNLSIRRYILNRPKKLNALSHSMLKVLQPKIEEWNKSELCSVIVGQGVGRAFCAGGDVADVVANSTKASTRRFAIQFFQEEFELNGMLAALKKPYVSIMDGITLGGGVGLAAPAYFRVATENTVFGMPETNIGYTPDVGSNFYLSKLDGQLGTYLALTGTHIKGRAVYELGFATHYISSRRIPILLERLSSIEDNVSQTLVNQAIEELSAERDASEPPAVLVGDVRAALDSAFMHERVEDIFADLEALSTHKNPAVVTWAQDTLTTMKHRSPTSLKVALRAIRLAKGRPLRDVLDTDFTLAKHFCNNGAPDFSTGVRAVLVERVKGRPAWNPPTVEEVSDEAVDKLFDPATYYPDPDTPETTSSNRYAKVTLNLPEPAEMINNPMRFALPSEREIGQAVRGESRLAGATGLTRDELVGRFEKQYNGKMGVKEKVLEVVGRQCQIVDNNDGNFVWLRWNSDSR